MNLVQRAVRAADELQQRHDWLAVPVAVWKKFGDDQAGNLAALVAYYAFVAIFPLLLVLVTVLDIVLKNDSGLRQRVLNAALTQYPVVGPDLVHSIGRLHETGFALVIGLLGTFIGARGVASALQNALNSAWEIPFDRRPHFPWSWLRSFALMFVIGLGFIVTTSLTTLAGGAGRVLSGAGAHVLAVAVSLVLNFGLFWLGFRIAHRARGHLEAAAARRRDERDRLAGPADLRRLLPVPPARSRLTAVRHVRARARAYHLVVPAGRADLVRGGD